MDPIKEAFSKIKEDIYLLKNKIYELKDQINEIQTIQTHIYSQIGGQTDKQTNNQTYVSNIPHKILSSLGSKGVPTDKQTNRQTPQQTQHSFLKRNGIHIIFPKTQFQSSLRLMRFSILLTI